MTIPELTRRRAEKSLDELIVRRVPPRAREKMRLSFSRKGDRITLFEHHALIWKRGTWSNSPIAQFRYDAASGRWALFWSNRSRRWYHYDRLRPQIDFAVLIAEVDNDPINVFWG